MNRKSEAEEEEEDILNDVDDELKHIVHLGYLSLRIAKTLYAKRKVYPTGYFRHLKNRHVFKSIEAQLGFLFDILYTKATIIYTKQGLVLRLINVLSIVSALTAFHIIVIIDNSTNNAKYYHSSFYVDIVITYILFVGAISLEIYAFVSLILSDWTILWLTKKNTPCPLANSVYSAISRCRMLCCNEKRWSEFMGQLNLVDICLKETEDTLLPNKISFNFFNLLPRKGQIMVDDDLKSCIFRELARTDMLRLSGGENVVSERVQYLAEKTASVFDQNDFEFANNSTKFQIDESIIIWHVATSICYYCSNNNNYDHHDDEEIRKKREASKKVSDYLLYILLMRPSMLPDRMERIEVVTKNFDYAIRLFIIHRKNIITPIENISEGCKLLRENNSPYYPWNVTMNAGKLASKLEDNGDEKLWDEIWEAWVVMLTYSAYYCEWVSHAQQLANGGEFLTHISILLTIYGICRRE